MEIKKEIQKNWKVYVGGFISGVLAELGLMVLFYSLGIPYFEIIGVI